MNIYLIRHTPVAVPRGTCYGFADVDVTDDWKTFAQAVKRKLPDTSIRDDNVFTSPLTRCALLSAEIGPTPIADDRLKEMNYGRWEGQLWDEIGREQLDAWLSNLEHYKTPDGESLGEVRDRGVAFLDDLRETGLEDAFVITHGGMVRCLIAHAIGLDLAHAARLSIDYASVTQLKIDRDHRRMEKMNV